MALPCSHEILWPHADGSNPGSTPLCPNPHTGIPPSPLSKRVGCSNQFNFEANFPFTFVSAYCLPVYASQWPLPDTTQDSVRGCWLSFATVVISNYRISCACKAQCPQNRAYGSVHGSSCKAYPLRNIKPMCQLSVGSYFLSFQVNKPAVGVGSRHRSGV